MNRWSWGGALVALCLMATTASAQEDGADAVTIDADESIAQDAQRTRWAERHAFERDFAIGIYGLGWAGPYLGGGGGVRLRWEPFDKLGVEVYSDHLAIEDPDGMRHDHPIGFNLFVPFRIGERWRIRPLFGFCTVFSFVHPDQEGVDRIDDVHFGAHLGAGVELAMGKWTSLFVDVQGIAYVGHSRTAGGWAVHVGDQLDLWGVVQGQVGIQVHL